MLIEAVAAPELLLTLAAGLLVAPLIVGELASGVIGGLANLFAPQGDSIQSFAGQSAGGVSVDPRDVLAQFLRGMGTYGKFMTERAEQPFQFSNSARVQTPNWFSGGGMPMSIGVGGVDQGYYPYTGHTPPYQRGGPGKTMGAAPFGGYGDAPAGPIIEGGLPDWADGGGGGGGGGDGAGGGGGPGGGVAQSRVTAADQLAEAPATANPGPNPSPADFSNMLSALRANRGMQ